MTRMLHRRSALVVSTSVILGLLFLYLFNILNIGKGKLFMAEEISVPFLNVKEIPDPTSVVTTWDWYFLDQISSSLIKWNPQENLFEGVLAESWHISKSDIEFQIRPNLTFSNGSKITAYDVAASIKRTLVKRNSSHFRPWELLVGCDGLKRMDDSCAGIEVLSDLSIRFKLKYPSESFFLYMACPEGGIWSASELSQDQFKPQAFSGPYKVSSKEESFFLLQANGNWVQNDKFSKRPARVKAFWGSEAVFRDGLKQGKFDLILDLERPFLERDFPKDEYSIKSTAFNTLYYLFGVNGRKAKLGRACLSELWSKAFPSSLAPATSFLPFVSLSGINKEQIMNALPDGQCQAVRVGYLEGYFSKDFVNFLFGNSNFVLVPMGKDQYYDSFTKAYSRGDLDFVLSPYVASERYPSVQINFLMEDREIPFNLSALDHRDEMENKKAVLNKVQTWMVQEQQVIPLVFGKAQLMYKQKIEIGRQPIVDSELQLWRVNETN